MRKYAVFVGHADMMKQLSCNQTLSFHAWYLNDQVRGPSWDRR